MKPVDKLKEIEEWNSVETNIPSKRDTEWLINRLKQLEKAARNVIKHSEDTCTIELEEALEDE